MSEEQDKKPTYRIRSYLDVEESGPLCEVCGMQITKLHGFLPYEFCQKKLEDLSEISEPVKDLDLVGLCSCASSMRYNVSFYPGVGFDIQLTGDAENSKIAKPKF